MPTPELAPVGTTATAFDWSQLQSILTTIFTLVGGYWVGVKTSSSNRKGDLLLKAKFTAYEEIAGYLYFAADNFERLEYYATKILTRDYIVTEIEYLNTLHDNIQELVSKTPDSRHSVFFSHTTRGKYLAYNAILKDFRRHLYEQKEDIEARDSKQMTYDIDDSNINESIRQYSEMSKDAHNLAEDIYKELKLPKK